MKLDGCIALVTGASAGLGREFARQLSGRAQTLVLVARREDRLLELRGELKGSVHVFAADLAQEREIARLLQWLKDESIAVDLLINNAGLGDRGNFAGSDAAKTRAMLAVNVMALTQLTHELLPGMIARRRGGILNVSSVASFLPMPNFAVYAASKAFVTRFSEALRTELHGSGVVVTTLCPGPVHTEFDRVAKRGDEHPGNAPDFVYVPAAEVVHTGLAGIESDRALVVPGFFMKFFRLIAAALPLAFYRITGRARR